MKKLVAGLVLAALALAPATAQVNLNLNGPQPTVDSTGATIDPATKQGQGLPTDAPCTTYDATACGQIGIQKQVSKSTATVAATVTAPGTAATTAQGAQGVPGGVPMAVRTQLPGTAINRSAVIGFVGTASAATSASTAATLVVTSNFVNQAGGRSGIPLVGQLVTGSGIPAGTTITAASETATPNTFNVTLSQAATLASGAAVTSGGPQFVMAANPARVSFKQNNQSAGACGFSGTGVGTLDANSQQLLGGTTIETPDSFGTTTAISDLCAVAAAPVHIIERTYP